MDNFIFYKSDLHVLKTNENNQMSSVASAVLQSSFRLLNRGLYATRQEWIAIDAYRYPTLQVNPYTRSLGLRCRHHWTD